jgi:vacuolar-type H+-ATPase subunit H
LRGPPWERHMSSNDLLEKLFDVEREAEKIVEAAKAEARKRAESAKSASRALVESAREKALAAAKADESSAKAAIEAEYERSLESFKSALASSNLDRKAFDETCRSAIEELYPR